MSRLAAHDPRPGIFFGSGSPDDQWSMPAVGVGFDRERHRVPSRTARYSFAFSRTCTVIRAQKLVTGVPCSCNTSVTRSFARPTHELHPDCRTVALPVANILAILGATSPGRSRQPTEPLDGQTVKSPDERAPTQTHDFFSHFGPDCKGTRRQRQVVEVFGASARGRVCAAEAESCASLQATMCSKCRRCGPQAAAPARRGAGRRNLLVKAHNTHAAQRRGLPGTQDTRPDGAADDAGSSASASNSSTRVT